jgi:uncharacterized protein
MDIKRSLVSTVELQLSSLRGVVISGARQSGKTTLLRQIPGIATKNILTFDDPDELFAATNDPTQYVNNLAPGTAIDEFQRAGNPFLLALKWKLDRDQSRGQILLAGSTSFLTSKRLADSLAGRVGILDLWPLSVGEVRGSKESFIDAAFQDPGSLLNRSCEALTRSDAADLITSGGFPEVISLSAKARPVWFKSYLATITTKDVIDEVGDVRKVAEFRRLLELVIARTGEEARSSALADDSGLHISTVSNYLQLANDLLLTHELPAWANSATTRAKRHAKRYVVDTGLAVAAMGVDRALLADPRSNVIGSLLETFVVNELAKQRGWAQTDIRLHHFRDRDGLEVDVLLVGPGQKIVGIEVKASSLVTNTDAKNLMKLSERLGDQFVHGFIVHLGDRPRQLSSKITAIPLAMLWS